jgi:hypothetical protein
MSRHTTQAGPGSEFFTRTEFIQPPVAKESLIAWYPFRAGTGEDLTAGDSRFGDTTDYSAVVNGATFKPNGGTTDIQTGANSGAFDFDGTDDTLDLGTVADSDQSLTIMTWVKPDAATLSTFTRLITKINATSFPDGNLLLDITENNEFRFLVLTGDFNQVISNAIATGGAYFHVAGRYDFSAGDIELFINGQSVSINSTVGQMPANASQPWRIGADDPPDGNDEFLNGTADGTRIYQAALSDSQINQIYLNTEP